MTYNVRYGESPIGDILLVYVMSNIASNDIVSYKTDLHDTIVVLFDIVKIYAFSRSNIYTSNEFIDQFKKNL